MRWFKVFLPAILYIIIGYSWAGYEIWIYGEAQPNWIDSIVCLILSISLYFNILHYLNIK